MESHFSSFLLITLLLSIFCQIEQMNAQKFSDVKKLSAKSTILQLDGRSFQEYAANKHNYSMIVLFSTENKQVKCGYCEAVNNNFKTVAQHYRKAIGGDSTEKASGYDSQAFLKNPIIFGYVDVTTAQELIKQAKWQEIPKLLHIPPRQEKGNQLMFSECPELLSDFSPERIGEFIKEKTGSENFKIPADMTNTILTYAAGIVLLFVVVTRVIPNFSAQYKQPKFWFMLSLGAYAFAMAGTVFNSINKPPWYYKHPSGQTFWIYPQQRQQFIAEGFMMAGLLTLAAILFAGFGGLIPNLKGAMAKRAGFAVLLIAFYMVYNAIFTIFKIKVNWYPF